MSNGCWILFLITQWSWELRTGKENRSREHIEMIQICELASSVLYFLLQTAAVWMNVLLLRTPQGTKLTDRSWDSVRPVTVFAPAALGHRLETAWPALWDTCGSSSSASSIAPPGTKLKLDLIVFNLHWKAMIQISHLVSDLEVTFLECNFDWVAPWMFGGLLHIEPNRS